MVQRDRKVAAKEAWKAMNRAETYFLRIVGDRFHYEVLQNPDDAWDLYFGDDEQRKEKHHDNELIGSYATAEAAKNAATSHAEGQLAA